MVRESGWGGLEQEKVSTLADVMIMLELMSRLTPSRAHLNTIVGRRFVQPALLFPIEYLLFVFASAMDVILTWLILEAGGRELNPLAEVVINYHGLNGMVAYKFALVVLVVILCESIGRLKMVKGRALAWFCVLLTSAVVTWSLALITIHQF